MSSDEFAVIVLAGGASTRMGGPRNKLFLQVGDMTVIDRVIDACRRAGAADIILTGPPGHPSVRHASDVAGVRAVIDDARVPGPVGGIAAGAFATHAQRVLVLAGDAPFVDATWMERLAGFVRADQRVDAVVPRTRAGQLLVGSTAWRRSCLIDSTEQIRRAHAYRANDAARRGPSLHQLVAQARSSAEARIRIVDVDDVQARNLFDVDTPDDLARARERSKP